MEIEERCWSDEYARQQFCRRSRSTAGSGWVTPPGRTGSGGQDRPRPSGRPSRGTAHPVGAVAGYAPVMPAAGVHDLRVTHVDCPPTPPRRWSHRHRPGRRTRSARPTPRITPTCEAVVDQGWLPRQVVDVLDSGAGSEGAGGGHHVCRVAGGIQRVPASSSVDSRRPRTPNCSCCATRSRSSATNSRARSATSPRGGIGASKVNWPDSAITSPWRSGRSCMMRASTWYHTAAARPGARGQSLCAARDRSPRSRCSSACTRPARMPTPPRPGQPSRIPRGVPVAGAGGGIRDVGRATGAIRRSPCRSVARSTVDAPALPASHATQWRVVLSRWW
ncbi:hypothetical protein B0I31_114139 [Saccharothrix carnea]|uniref:Uncharacterized protein n=1 Tax=Saccharothrix carnea TaxID=1280637 RepID=A0A2P8I1G9_SACCR|nr:hypothetical protein B0I31_114139 [Saccharothrix carnea]